MEENSENIKKDNFFTVDIWADLNCNNETKYTVVWSWIQTLLGRRTLFRGRGGNGATIKCDEQSVSASAI